ncbi:S8 family peptidase [Saliphagus sp. LR7]|uniref:S8 family peptidase n=1 Tax=Saliphagus sp. LR7 TaxID=2282654 RepID=UPI000DF8315E|nr:S8 family peptidase [Saliphagus sp. LR7]
MPDDDTPAVDRRTALKLLGAAGAGGLFSGLTVATPGRGAGPKKDEILVGVAKGAVSDLEGSVRRHVPGRAKVVGSNDRIGYVAVKFPSHTPNRARENFVNTITRKEHVRYAEPNVTFEALFTPNDPRYGDQYAPEMVGCEGAWDATLGDSDVTISVVDQGIQYDHADLEGNVDGSVSNYGRDFAGGDADPYPVQQDENHGTHVGGIAAGGTDNGTGHAGISDCSLLSARALDESGGGSLSDIADAITWSADQGADVVNLSLGGGGSTTTMQNAVSYAQNQGSLVVAAAGNDYGASVSYPAAYDECLAVSALDPDGSLAAYSNVGEEIELCAPGSNVLSTIPWDDYDQLSGTSMASPVVAGVAGLAISQWGTDTADTRMHLKNTAEDVGLSADEQGSGRVDAEAAVGTEPGDGGGGGGGGGGGTCGDARTTTAISDQSLSSGGSDCWSYEWELADTCQVVVDLQGPSDATFDLYANEGGGCPTTASYDHRSYNWGSNEEIVVDDPSQEPLYVMVDAWSGSGTYDLEITEKGI